ncbi:regulatory protein, luxR family [Pustulibacterium marinum]|uniref:Regulatory protein, luxR family n=1 Tax=Pustulibacterium marinum TaxID=1224947 RepID=A0A1I7F3N6_9FLAO|nr:LuxR C-terminal-related transcriptional regulator [Pustulibacterium marinum]SFU30767.1 regulatory protein, luxR family [Pustulibacterium marinum]
MMRFHSYIFILIFLISSTLRAQVETYPVTNYAVNEYGAANQNWGISLNDKEHVFVANHQGLLLFDGQHWELKKLPNNTIVRSVLSDYNRVYTGSYEEFGYWKENEFGVYEYTSLTSLIDNSYEFQSEEFWEIVKWNNKIVFRSFRALYIYDGKTIQVVEPNLIITKIFPFEDQLILGTENRGVYSCTSTYRILPLEGSEEISDLSIADIALLSKDELIIGSKYDGVFSIRNKKLSRWSSELNQILEEDQLNKIAVINSSEVVFGTIKNGLVFYDLNQKSITHFNRSLGLQNNTILGLACGKDHLWVAQDNGISVLDVTSGITFFNDLSGQLGTVYDVKQFEGTTYLGSNTGVFYFENEQLKFLEGSQGHVWSLTLVDGKLLCGHNDGLFQIKNKTFQPIAGLEGTFSVSKIPNEANSYLAGTYIGISKLTYYNGQWQTSRIRNVDFPVSAIVFEAEDTIWATHPYKGLYRIALNDNMTEAELLKFNDHEVRLTDYQTRIHKINDNIVFYVSNKWFTYNKEQNQIIEFDEYKHLNGYKLIFNNEGRYWFIDSDRNELQFVSKKLALAVTNTDLLSRITPLYEKIFQKNDSIYSIPLNDGFASLNLNELKKERISDEVRIATLRRVYTDQHEYQIKNGSEIPFDEATSLTVSFGFPYGDGEDFTYELEGPIDQTGETLNGDVILQNLTYGQYILKVLLPNSDDKILSYTFKVLPPWYLSEVMILGYILLSVLLIYLIFYLNKRSMQKYQRKLHLKMQEEEAKKKAELERVALHKEVELKQKELMNSTLIISKKNELLLELKNEFKRIKDNSVNEYRVKSLIAKTTDAISNEEDWEVFETNFNELHDDFFKKLIKAYPKLTSKDLKLCAYIKMGLMSKEISPLMGITTRGVELHRYRLRKKLDLSKEQDLTKYLLSF